MGDMDIMICTAPTFAIEYILLPHQGHATQETQETQDPG